MAKCVMCQREIPNARKNKDTCSSECALEKMAAWTLFLAYNKVELIKEAVKWYAGTKSDLDRKH